MAQPEGLEEVKITLHTGSKFIGLWQPTLHEMEHSGVYIYPDNTRYKGQFHKGKFHGLGRISMPPPCNFTFVGQFEKGKLVRLDDMVFRDDLRFDHFDGKTLNLDSWEYCNGDDRRYISELKDGLWPVGSKKANISAQTPTRKVHKGQYDNEEGIFNPETGYVSRIPEPFEETRFLCCPNEKVWIERYCRSGDRPFEASPVSKIGVPINEDCPKIMKLNIESARIEDSEQRCICLDRIHRKRYFDHFIEKFMSREGENTKENIQDLNDDNYSQSSSRSADSFSESSMLEMLNDANKQINLESVEPESSYMLHEFNSAKARRRYELYKSSSYLLIPSGDRYSNNQDSFEDSV